MPWCPNCRNEYKNGITICADCNIQLVKELAPIDDLTAIAGLKEEAHADRFIKFLASEKLEAVKEYSDEDDGYIISVSDKYSKKAKKLFHAFYTVELESTINNKLKNDVNGSSNVDLLGSIKNYMSEDPYVIVSDYYDVKDNNTTDSISKGKQDSDFNGKDSIDKDSIDNNSIEKADYDALEAYNNLRQATSSTYVKKADKSKDLKSTAVTFVFFGVIGVIFTTLNIVGVFSFFDNLLSYIVMSIVFIGCILIGVMSYKDSKKADKEAVEEEELTNIINEWLKNNIKNDFIKLYSNTENTDEVNFLTIIEGIKNAVIGKFGEMDEAYLDNIVEEYYNKEFDV